MCYSDVVEMWEARGGRDMKGVAVTQLCVVPTSVLWLWFDWHKLATDPPAEALTFLCFHDDYVRANWKAPPKQKQLFELLVKKTLDLAGSFRCRVHYVVSVARSQSLLPEAQTRLWFAQERKKERVTWNVPESCHPPELTNALAQGLFKQSNEHPRRERNYAHSCLPFPFFLSLSSSPSLSVSFKALIISDLITGSANRRHSCRLSHTHARTRMHAQVRTWRMTLSVCF